MYIDLVCSSRELQLCQTVGRKTNQKQQQHKYSICFGQVFMKTLFIFRLVRRDEKRKERRNQNELFVTSSRNLKLCKAVGLKRKKLVFVRCLFRRPNSGKGDRIKIQNLFVEEENCFVKAVDKERQKILVVRVPMHRLWFFREYKLCFFCSRRELHQTVGIGIKELVAVKLPMLQLVIVLKV